MAYGKAHVDQEVCVKQPSLEGLAEMDRFEESQCIHYNYDMICMSLIRPLWYSS